MKQLRRIGSSQGYIPAIPTVKISLVYGTISVEVIKGRAGAISPLVSKSRQSYHTVGNICNLFILNQELSTKQDCSATSQGTDASFN